MSPLWITSEQQTEYINGLSESCLQELIARVYRQVLGNIHVTDFNRLPTAESLLRNQSISVRQFVDAVGKSELYKKLFFFPNNPYRFIELNFKHFLGRAPRSQAEISTHVKLLAEQGYDAEISSYTDSEEYLDTFGEDAVPYDRADSESISANKDFVRILNLSRGRASSDRGVKPGAIRQVAANTIASPQKPVFQRNVVNNTNGVFTLVIDVPGNSRVNRRSARSVKVTYAQLSSRIQSIHKSGGRIVSISPTAG
jgi:hypothetical protein